jgi:hypothetical protein
VRESHDDLLQSSGSFFHTASPNQLGFLLNLQASLPIVSPV